jgi:hypothetical protein
MASPLTSDDYPGLLKRAPHEEDCENIPSSCGCKVESLWAIVSEAVPITDNTGKWLIFPGALGPTVDALWASITSSTEEGRLGFAAKITLADRENCAIMVYTADHTNVGDVKRIGDEIRALLEIAGVSAGRANKLKYKTDEATRAGIFSNEGLARRGGDGTAAKESWVTTYMEGAGKLRDAGTRRGGAAGYSSSRGRG